MLLFLQVLCFRFYILADLFLFRLNFFMLRFSFFRFRFHFFLFRFRLFMFRFNFFMFRLNLFWLLFFLLLMMLVFSWLRILFCNLFRWFLCFRGFRSLYFDLWFGFIWFFLFGFFLHSRNLTDLFDIIRCFLRRMGAGMLEIGIMFDRTQTSLINVQIPPMVGIFNKLKDSIGQECGMREISKGKFREKQISIACDFKGSHFLSSDFDDRDGRFGHLCENGLLQFLSKREVGGLIVARAPGMLLAVRADLNSHFHERNLLWFRYHTVKNACRQVIK